MSDALIINSVEQIGYDRGVENERDSIALNKYAPEKLGYGDDR